MEYLNETNVLDKGLIALVETMGSDQTIVDSARKSYKTKKKYKSTTEEMIRLLLRSGHGTPFEMAEMRFYVRAPIFVFRQWHRHRIASINEMSGRYTELEFGEYVPENWRFQDTNNKQGSSGNVLPSRLVSDGVRENYQRNLDLYKSMLDNEIAKEQARIVLPVATYSDMYWKGNLRSIFNFLKLRMDSHAQWEIRQYANAMAEMVKEHFPLAYEAFEDYILNAVTFSAVELKCLDFSQGLTVKPNSCEILSKRENMELMGKVMKLNPMKFEGDTPTGEHWLA